MHRSYNNYDYTNRYMVDVTSIGGMSELENINLKKIKIKKIHQLLLVCLFLCFLLLLLSVYHLPPEEDRKRLCFIVSCFFVYVNTFS